MNRTVSLVLLLLIGCPARHNVDAAAGDPATVLEAARARVLPNPLKARFNVKLHSKPLDVAASTGGGLIVKRPGEGRLDLMNPLGAPVITVASDGAGLEVLMMGQKKELVAADAEAVIRATTGGVAGLDDALAVLTGDVPFDAAEVKRVQAMPADDPTHPGLVLAILDGPKGTQVEVWLDPATATPVELIAVDKKGQTLMSAVYDPFEAVGTDLMPTHVTLYVPSLDLTIEAKYRGWEALADVPEGWIPRAPADWAVEPLEDAVKKLTAAPH